MSFLSKWFTNEDTTPDYEDGFDDGQVSGYDLGKTAGLHQGYEQGFNDGLEWEDKEDAEEMVFEEALAEFDEVQVRIINYPLAIPRDLLAKGWNIAVGK